MHGATGKVSGTSRRIWAWCAAWLILTLLGSWAQFTLWYTPDHLRGPLSGEFGRAVASLLVLPTQAFSVASAILLNHRTDLHVASTIIAVGVAWACWLAGLAIVLRLRRWVVRPRPGPIDAPAHAGVASLHAPSNPSRRSFLFDGPVAVGGVVAAGASTHSVLVEPFDLRVERYTIPIRDLPTELVGLRLLQISDTHLGPFIPPAFIERVVRASLAVAPDAFLLTGDYVHRREDCNQKAAELFVPLVRSGTPVLGVLGNHDWFGDGRDMSRRLTEVGVRMIDNARVFLDAATRQIRDDAPASGICIAGLGDFSKDTMDLEAALGGVPPGMPRLVLQHQPDAAEDPMLLNAPRMDLVFSGHTHGGQIRLPLIGAPVTLSRYGEKYATGLAQGPRCPVVVSRGVGMSFLPVRIGVRPEIVEVTLTRL